MDTPSPVVSKFLQFLQEVVANGLSDVHITTDDYPFIRTPDRKVSPVSSYGRITQAELTELISYMEPTIDLDSLVKLRTGNHFIFQYEGTRFRTNISRNQEGLAIAMRTIKKKTPTAEDIGLKGVMLDLLQRDR